MPRSRKCRSALFDYVLVLARDLVIGVAQTLVSALMGYDVHITRGDWWDQKSARISDQEWRDIVDQDPDLTLTGELTATTPSGETIRYSNPLLATWTAHPGGGPVPFDFRKGRVVVKSPDDAVLEKMRSLATALTARVRGDEGEFYD